VATSPLPSSGISHTPNHVFSAGETSLLGQPWIEKKGLAWGDPVPRGLVGLLAGFSVALGFLVPPRSRVVRCPSCSGEVRP
jgi:hypothetical protein